MTLICQAYTSDRAVRSLIRLVGIASLALVLCACRAPGGGNAPRTIGTNHLAQFPESEADLTVDNTVDNNAVDNGVRPAGNSSQPGVALEISDTPLSADRARVGGPSQASYGTGTIAQVGFQQPLAGACPVPCLPTPHTFPSLPQVVIPGPYPMPRDEYLYDGGDRLGQVNVAPDWSIDGLDQEDTVAHYDTLSGETHVEATNRVPIYAPRFASVRKISGIGRHQNAQIAIGMNRPVRIAAMGDRLEAGNLTLPLQAGRHHKHSPAHAFDKRTRGHDMENVQSPVKATYGFQPYEDFAAIRRGQYEMSEKPWLSERLLAAQAWTSKDGVKVILDGQKPVEGITSKRVASTHIYELKGKARLRIIKVASKHTALPGETIDFTLRFDNVGDQTIGNVTVVDNLSTRLEYVDKSEKHSLDATFITQQNEGESLVLRWEITKPLKVGQGGLIRFRCKVR